MLSTIYLLTLTVYLRNKCGIVYFIIKGILIYYFAFKTPSVNNLIHHRSKRASGSGDHGHAEHTLVETLTHAFHLGSLVILSLLVFEVDAHGHLFGLRTRYISYSPTRYRQKYQVDYM